MERPRNDAQSLVALKALAGPVIALEIEAPLLNALDDTAFAAERLTPALLALDTAALHHAWADLLRELSTRERKTFWYVRDLLISVVDKLGGDAALTACATQLRHIQRLWP